jgi:putative ABC transport system permease protein
VPETTAIVAPIRGRASSIHRWRMMARIGLRMMFHDKVKFVGTLVGVVFAVILIDQQSGAGLGVLDRNAMYVDHAHADLWIAPALSRTLQPGKYIQDVAVTQARSLPGVAWAEPILYGTATVSLPTGRTEPVTLIGTRGPTWRGGPFNVVAGDRDAMAQPDAIVFEDSDREKFGGVDLGSVREVNGHRLKAVAFTWGAVPFGTGGSYAFADLELARDVLAVPSDQASYVLIGVDPGVDVHAVQRELRSRLPNVAVLIGEEFKASITHYVLFETPVGLQLVSTMVIALIVGLLVVGLMMFSTVVDNLREFGTLKAIGATTFDLVRLLWTQASVYAVLGSLVGVALASQMATATRKATLAIQIPPTLMLLTLGGALVMCVMASTFAALRIRSLEPAMVFR